METSKGCRINWGKLHPQSLHTCLQEPHLNAGLSSQAVILERKTNKQKKKTQKNGQQELNLMFINMKGNFLPHLTNILVGTVWQTNFSC